MEFGDQSNVNVIGNKPPHPSTQAHRRVVALLATLLVVIVGATGFWFFTPKSHPDLNGGHVTKTATVSAPVVFLTPGTLVTPGPNNSKDPIGPPTMGKSYTTSNSLPVIKNQTSLFLPNDTVIIVAKVEGAKAKDKVSIKWFQNNEDLTNAFITEESTCCAQTMSGQPEDVLFQAQFPSVGMGRAELYYNTTLAYTLVFDVVPQTALYTPTPHT
jgi:hypothetical protein